MKLSCLCKRIFICIFNLLPLVHWQTRYDHYFILYTVALKHEHLFIFWLTYPVESGGGDDDDMYFKMRNCDK